VDVTSGGQIDEGGVTPGNKKWSSNKVKTKEIGASEKRMNVKKTTCNDKNRERLAVNAQVSKKKGGGKYCDEGYPTGKGEQKERGEK